MSIASLKATRVVLVATALALGLVLPTARAEAQQAKVAATVRAAAGAGQATTLAARRFQPNRFAGRAWKHYQLVWGVDSLGVKLVESGEVVRFTYRVLDPAKAKALNDEVNEPSLIDPRAGIQLVIPRLENVGQLRQTASPEAGKAYWMAFSNKGRPVKKGDRVDVVIGPFHAEGLVVD